MCETRIEIDPSSLDDVSLGAHIAALETLIRRAQAAQAAAVRVFEVRDAADGFGYGSVASWLCAHTGSSERDARALVTLGRARDLLPELAAVVAEGAATVAHLRVAAAAARPLAPATVAAGDRVLAGLARELDAGRFATAVRAWVARVAPLEFERDSEKRYEARWFSISETFAGMRSIAGMLDPENGLIVEQALAALLAGNPADDGRSRDRQRADALVDLVRTGLTHAATAPASGAFVPEILVHATVGAMVGDTGAAPTILDSVGPLTTGAWERLGCDARLRRLLLDPAGVPVELGRATRTVPSGLRKLVALRDGGCRYPGCTRGAVFTEAHHVVFWRHGGRTDADNLVLLCRYHHYVIHDRGHELKLRPDGTVTITKPDGRTLTSKPRGPTSTSGAGRASYASP